MAPVMNVPQNSFASMTVVGDGWGASITVTLADHLVSPDAFASFKNFLDT